MSFYDDYVGSMDIYQLGQFDVATRGVKHKMMRFLKNKLIMQV